jgi:hypothetical protein
MKKSILILSSGLILMLALTSCNTAKKEVTGVKTFDVGKGGDHKNGLLIYDPTKYGFPPTGGTHNQVWQNCGVYDKPVAAENAVHALEHGAVWITYQPDLPSTEVDKLKAMVKDHPYTLLSPYNGLPSKIVVSGWGKQKAYPAVDEEIKTFIELYSDKGSESKAPEVGAACTGGTDAIDER